MLIMMVMMIMMMMMMMMMILHNLSIFYCISGKNVLKCSHDMLFQYDKTLKQA